MFNLRPCSQSNYRNRHLTECQTSHEFIASPRLINLLSLDKWQNRPQKADNVNCLSRSSLNFPIELSESDPSWIKQSIRLQPRKQVQSATTEQHSRCMIYHNLPDSSIGHHRDAQEEKKRRANPQLCVKNEMHFWQLFNKKKFSSLIPTRNKNDRKKINRAYFNLFSCSRMHSLLAHRHSFFFSSSAVSEGALWGGWQREWQK